MTADTDPQQAIEDTEHLVRNWVDRSEKLNGMTLRDMVLYALREEEQNKIDAIKAHTQT